MNTTITLFGGLAAVMVLYAIGGAIPRLQLLLRALFAGAIPLAVYFALILSRWPGLDVVAIHISVFIAAAVVLSVLTQFRKRGGGRMHWAPKLLMFFFLGLALLMAGFLYIANNGLPEPIARWWLGGRGEVLTGFSGVVPHGQNAANAISSELKETHQEAQLGWQVEVTGLEDGTGRTRHVEIQVRDRTGLPVDGIGAELVLQRPGAPAPARVLRLQATQGGVYAGSFTLPEAGRWVAELRLSREARLRYHATEEIVAP